MNQVNLFKRIPTPPVEPLGFTRMLLAMGGWIALLIILTFFFALQIAWSTYKLSGTKESFNVLNKQYKELQKQYFTPAEKKKAEKELEQLKTNLAARKDILDHLTGKHSQADLGFSRYFDSLAQVNMKHLWLTSFNFNGKGGALSMSGHARQTFLLPRFVQELVQTPAFKGRKFETLALTGSKNRKAKVGKGKNMTEVVKAGLYTFSLSDNAKGRTNQSAKMASVKTPKTNQSSPSTNMPAMEQLKRMKNALPTVQ